MTNVNERPNKTESLSLDAREISVLRYLDLYVIGKDGCIYRKFVNDKGKSHRLIVLNGDGFMRR